MGRLIDARTSMNIDAMSPTVTDFFPSFVPVLMGQVGLNVPPDTTGIIRVQLTGMAGLFSSDPDDISTLILTIVRGTSPTDPQVFLSANNYNPEEAGFHTIEISAADYNVPAPASGVLAYSLFGMATSAMIGRVGPENLNASAYTG
ncbi:hypothetical protein [Paenibacillus silvisoli]|uniref:hypothetical protein n=1 Tax=Paenibacillus silvisoli TaxID=3110539 RepID=UPI002805F6BD|nr:hypothetical protein [Paenibacillus silvisoli]